MSKSDWRKQFEKAMIEVVAGETGDAAATADIMVCRLITAPLIMADNLVGHCRECQRMVQFRPDAPKEPARVCEECALKVLAKDKHPHFVITEQTLLELLKRGLFMIFRTGDRVTIQTDERIVPGEVALASGNGVSLMLRFEAILHGHAGMMPVTRQDDGSFISLIGGHPVKVLEGD